MLQAFVVLREPVERLWSYHYYFHDKRGAFDGAPDDVSVLPDENGHYKRRDRAPGITALVERYGAQLAMQVAISRRMFCKTKEYNKEDPTFEPCTPEKSSGWAEGTWGNIQTSIMSYRMVEGLEGLGGLPAANVKEGVREGSTDQIQKLQEEALTGRHKFHGIVNPMLTLTLTLP